MSDRLTDSSSTIVDVSYGMMHFCGTGPAGATCLSCEWFGTERTFNKPQKARRCEKWARWYRNAHDSSRAPDVPLIPETLACSHYERGR